jgi:hypothetical protein
MAKTLTEMYGKNATVGLAERLHKAWHPGDKAHMEFILGIKLPKGLTPEVAYKIAVAYPDYAKKLIARKWK